MEGQKPKIQIIADERAYNALLWALERNAQCGIKPIADAAGALFHKIKTYCRFFVDSDGAACADVRFFDKEAGQLIWQYIFSIAAFADDGGNYFAEHKALRTPREKSKE
jgi:hypothetical protein